MKTGEHNNHSAGGWTQFEALTPADKKVFDQAMEGFVGVKYTPEKVSKQVVNGTNYRFKCTALPSTKDPHPHKAIVKIHAPIVGKPKIEEIEKE